MQLRLRKIEYYDTVSADLSFKVSEEYQLEYTCDDECKWEGISKEWHIAPTIIERKEI